MNPVIKEMARQWLVETLKKAGQAGGAVAFEEVLMTLPPDSFKALREAVQRVVDRRKIPLEVRVTPNERT